MNEKFIIREQDNLWWGNFPILQQAGFLNACSCRLHGESILTPDGFNLALHVGDDPQLVLKNRRRYAEAIGVDPCQFTTCAQVHGSKVTVVTEKLVGSGASSLVDTVADTDALITNLPLVPLLLFFADCIPILVADPVRKAIGLVHAGRKGTLAGIAVQTVRSMTEAFGSCPEDLVAAVGPSICSSCYEVGEDIKREVPAYASFFRASTSGKYFLDLWGINRELLIRAGVRLQNIFLPGVCTYENPELFFSYRREHEKTGRMGVCLCISRQ